MGCYLKFWNFEVGFVFGKAKAEKSFIIPICPWYALIFRAQAQPRDYKSTVSNQRIT